MKKQIFAILILGILAIIIPYASLDAYKNEKENQKKLYLESPHSSAYFKSLELEEIAKKEQEPPVNLKTIENIFEDYRKITNFCFYIQSGLIIVIIILLIIISKQHRLLKQYLLKTKKKKK